MADDTISTLAKRAPNVLSAARIPLSATLLFLKPFSPSFLIIYIACGLTDALDGFLARKFHAESVIGAELDSIADFMFFGSALYVFLTAIMIPPIIVLWALSIVIIRAAGLAMASHKFKSWAALHTHAFKVTAFAFFCFPFFCWTFGVIVAASLICGIATLATVEELLINSFADSFDPDVKSMRQLREARLLR